MALIIGTPGADFRNGTPVADTIYGLGADDRLLGWDGDDLIFGDRSFDGQYPGPAGHDYIQGGNGSDRIYGDAGNDRLYGESDNDNLFGGIGNDTMEGGQGSDRLFGESGNDTLNGGSGNDSMSGGSGIDTLLGGTGSDAMAGGSNDDTYYVDNTGDSVVELFNQGYDTIHSSVSYTLPDHVERLILREASPIFGFGNELDNVILGNIANNSLSGMEGNDEIRGDDGNDTILGGSGNDQLFGDGGNDVLSGVRSVPIGGSNPGAGEIDVLTGGGGGDRFTLGNFTHAYYSTGGGTDFAIMTDVSPSTDVIQLHGNAGEYVLQNTIVFVPVLGGNIGGTGIYRTTGGANDLVGLVQNQNGLNLNSALFEFAASDITIG